MAITAMVTKGATVISRLAIAALLAVACGSSSSSPPPVASAPGPVATITLVMQGADALTIEKAVVEPIEHAVVKVGGVRSVGARIEPGVAMVTVELESARVLETSLADVRGALERVRPQLPAELEPPVIARPRGPEVVTLRLAGASPAELSRLALERIARMLEREVGVAYVEVRNEVRTEIAIRPDPARLASYDITLHELSTALQARRDVMMPARGNDDLTSLVIAQRGESPVRLADVAVVEEMVTRDNRDPPEIAVHAVFGARPPDVTAAVRRALADVRAALPPAVTLEELAPPVARPALVIALLGPEWEVLERLADEARSELAAVAGIGEVTVDPSPGAPEVVAEPDRDRAIELRVSPYDLAASLVHVVGGRPIARLMRDNGEQSVTLRVLDGPDALAAYHVRSATGALIPLSELATLRSTSRATITRRDRSRVITLTCNGTDGALAAARRLVANRKLPAGYRVIVAPLAGDSTTAGSGPR